MAINFDSLPQGAPGPKLLDAGLYLVSVRGAEMKTPKVPKFPGEQYLNLSFDLINNEQGEQTKGVIYDMLFERESEYLRYKLKTFLDALNISFEGSFELSDLLSIVKGKKLIVNLAVDEKQEPARNTVALFSDNGHKPYHKETEWASLVNGEAVVAASDGEEDEDY